MLVSGRRLGGAVGSGWARCGGINSGVGIGGDTLVGPIGYTPRVLAGAAIDGARLLDGCRRVVGKSCVEDIGEANGVMRRKSWWWWVWWWCTPRRACSKSAVASAPRRRADSIC